MIAACRLWEKVSAKGNRYLIGRLGGIRALILENTRPEPGDDSTHTLMFAEAPAYDGTRAQAASAPFGRTWKPDLYSFSFISGVPRILSVSFSNHLTASGGVLAGAISTVSVANTKSG